MGVSVSAIEYYVVRNDMRTRGKPRPLRLSRVPRVPARSAEELALLIYDAYPMRKNNKSGYAKLLLLLMQ